MAQSRASEIAEFFRECLKEKGLKIDVVTLSLEEYENRTSMIADYAHEGVVI